MNKVILVVVWLLFAVSCDKPSGNNISGGGKGGKVTIRIVPEIYDDYVDTCTVYVKYGTLDAPANGIYDDSAVCTVVSDTPRAVFNDLTTGYYYFFAKGWHSGAGHAPDVKGGKNCTISSNGAYLYYLATFPYTP